ncbi:hypothetical protein [Haloferula sargassicola]|uniref:Anti sigma-E protein RseA N-terminal domain-containing protein n=1 Tax=Haloferula sargassicola TaxID=490096 RepID=A0ABP9ULI2_9BACT
METEFQRLEDELKLLMPRRLDPALLDCLAVSLGDEVAEGTLEARLHQARPSRPSAALSESLVATLDRIPFQPEANTLRFPAAPAAAPAEKSRMPWLAAAAAVALAGAWTATKMSPQSPSITNAPALVRQDAVDAPAPVASRGLGGNFVPASIDSAVRSTDDLGVRYNRQAKPMRVVRVTYMDHMKLRNEKGEIIETKVPRVEYVVIPERVD